MMHSRFYRVRFELCMWLIKVAVYIIKAEEIEYKEDGLTNG